MKRSHIIAVVVIAVAVAMLIAALSESSTFLSLAEAKANPGKEVKVKGFLDRSQAVIYEPSLDPNLTRFTLVDEDGIRCEVHLNKPKPYDFERAEDIVLTGSVENGVFHAKDMLLKCPSKYNEQSQITG